MRGALMAAPTSVEPVVQMPHAAPTMLNPAAAAAMMEWHDIGIDGWTSGMMESPWFVV